MSGTQQKYFHITGDLHQIPKPKLCHPTEWIQFVIICYEKIHIYLFLSSNNR